MGRHCAMTRARPKCGGGNPLTNDLRGRLESIKSSPVSIMPVTSRSPRAARVRKGALCDNAKSFGDIGFALGVPKIAFPKFETVRKYLPLREHRRDFRGH